MALNPLDYRSQLPYPEDGCPAKAAMVTLAIATVLLNTFLFAVALSDRRMLAFGVELIGCPALNIVVLAVAIARIPKIVRCERRHSWVAGYCIASVGIPLGAAGACIGLVHLVQLPGC